MFKILSITPRWHHYAIMCIFAFLFRAGTFYFYTQHQERYHQADSNDYHVAALCITHNYGMTYPTGRPIFWRTPGYPFYLSQFYSNHHTPNSGFKYFTHAHKKALWVQIVLCSCLPVLVFQLAFVLTATLPVAWLAALISVFHVGFVLASTYLLTDALAMLFFMLFLIFLFSHRTFYHVILSALSLSIFTWLRPNGQFIGIIAMLLLLFSQDPWLTKLKKIVLFFTVFALTLFPWFYRNYKLTDQWFFCPLFGLYLNAFNAPKILARTENIPLKEAHKQLSDAAGHVAAQELQAVRTRNSQKTICPENLCIKTAWPVIAAHPCYFIYDWLTEVIKTTFDLYSCQLVALTYNCFMWDPLVEYLPEKLYACLWSKPLPPLMRIVAWLELIISLSIWLGILAGLYVFCVKPLFVPRERELFTNYGTLWLKTGILIGATLMQTGGFGYARLRLPIEPLILILGLMFWWWFFKQKNSWDKK